MKRPREWTDNKQRGMEFAHQVLREIAELKRQRQAILLGVLAHMPRERVLIMCDYTGLSGTR
jgi:hypothetical protein